MSSANITPPDTSLAEALEKLLALVIGESLQLFCWQLMISHNDNDSQKSF